LNNNKRLFAFIDMIFCVISSMRCGTSYTQLILEASYYV